MPDPELARSRCLHRPRQGHKPTGVKLPPLPLIEASSWPGSRILRCPSSGSRAGRVAPPPPPSPGSRANQGRAASTAPRRGLELVGDAPPPLPLAEAPSQPSRATSTALAGARAGQGRTSPPLLVRAASRLRRRHPPVVDQLPWLERMRRRGSFVRLCVHACAFARACVREISILEVWNHSQFAKSSFESVLSNTRQINFLGTLK